MTNHSAALRSISWADTNTAANTVTEGAINGTVVGVAAKATLGNVRFTYSLSQGADAFAIDPTTGVISVKDGTLLDYETAASHNITVKATFGGITSSQNYTIALTDVYNVRDISHGGNFAATSENDYFVLDFDTLQSRVVPIGEINFTDISGFDPTEDKLVLENFNISSSYEDYHQTSFVGDNSNLSDDYESLLLFWMENVDVGRVTAWVRHTSSGSYAANHIIIRDIEITNGSAMLQQFGQIYSGDFPLV